MKLIIVQKSIQNSDYKIMLDDVKDSSADIVAFGELAVSGCNYTGVDQSKIPTLDELTKELRAYPFATMIGIPRFEAGNYYNSYVYVDNSSLQQYDKINLFEPMNEIEHYQAGKLPGFFKTEFGKLGISICYDIRFPELYDSLKTAGAEMICIPAAFPRVRIQTWRELLKERAIQTGLPVVGINAVGDDGTNEFGGSSMVIGKDGKIIAQADEINETIIEVEL